MDVGEQLMEKWILIFNSGISQVYFTWKNIANNMQKNDLIHLPMKHKHHPGNNPN